MSTSLITREELKQWLEQRSDFVLIDTGVLEYFQTSHLPKAQNACVYEVDFLNQVDSLAFPDSTTKRSRHSVPIVVYGSSTKSLARGLLLRSCRLPVTNRFSITKVVLRNGRKGVIHFRATRNCWKPQFLPVIAQSKSSRRKAFWNGQVGASPVSTMGRLVCATDRFLCATGNLYAATSFWIYRP